MTSTCGVVENYVSEITKLSVSFLKGAEDLEAAIRLGPMTRAKTSMVELERRANQLLNGGDQLNATYKAASNNFFPEIYSADAEMKGVLRKRTNGGIKQFAQVVIDESVTLFSSTPEFKVLGTEIAQMSYQHKVNINLLCNQMSGDALYSRVRPILAQACASKAQLAMTQFLATESVRSYKACVGPRVFGGTPALPLPGVTPASTPASSAENELKSLLDSSAALFEGSTKKSVSGKGVKSSTSKHSSSDAKDKVMRNLLDELSTPSKLDKPGAMPQMAKHDKPEKCDKHKKHGKRDKDDKTERRLKHDKQGKAEKPEKTDKARPGEKAVSIPKHGDRFSSDSDSSDSAGNLAQGALDNTERRKLKRKRSHSSPGSSRKKAKWPNPDTSSSEEEDDKDVAADEKDSQFVAGSIEARRERQWSMALMHMKFYRIDQGINIATLDPEPNKNDHSLFVEQCIKADGLHLDIRTSGYFDKIIERWESQGRHDKLVKRARKVLKRFKKMHFGHNEKLRPTRLARAFSMYNDAGHRVQVTSPVYCKVNMIGLYCLLFHTLISRYTRKKTEGPKKSSDAFCLLCS